MTPITLPSACDRTAAKSLHSELCDALGPAPIEIDASEVERIGQAMLQMLASAARSEGGIAINDPSEPVVEALRLAGLSSLLEEGIPSA